MLVSMALLSMVVLSASSAFGFFAQRWDGQLGKFGWTLENARDLMLTQEVLDTLMPYVVYDTDDKPVIYFEGNRNGFVAVSAKSVFFGAGHSVIRFSVRQNFDLSFDVIYEEAPMVGDVMRSVGQSIDFSAPLVLFSSIRSPKFEYYGWPSEEAKRGVDGVSTPFPPRWLADYNALQIGLTPIKIRLTFEGNDSYPYEILAAVTTEVPGLISRYTGSNQRRVNAKGENVTIENDCGC